MINENIIIPIKILNLLITGSSGQLGSELKNIVAISKEKRGSFEEQATRDFRFFFTEKNSLDIDDYSAIEKFCKAKAIDVIINCAAYTGVDKAENETQLAFKLNAHAVEKLARLAKKYSISLVHISTDYVFDGRQKYPYVERDLPNPLGVYGASKLMGEQLMQAVNPSRSIIIRTSWLYSWFGKNFLTTMLQLGRENTEINVNAEQIGSPTSARSLLLVILYIVPQLKNESVKIYHYSNEGFCSWFEFAQAIFDISEINCTVNPIASAAYPTLAFRPKYSVLSKQALQRDFKQTIIPWRDALELQLKTICV